MSVDNLKQDQAEAMGAIAAAQRNLSAAVAAETNAPEDKKESARSKIDQARQSIQIAVGDHSSVATELRMAEGMERKEESIALRKEDEAVEKKNEEAYNKQIQEKKDDAKPTSKASPSKAPGVTPFTGEDIVRSGKPPMTQDEILAEVAKLQKATMDKTAVPTEATEAPEASSEQVVSQGLASPTNKNSFAITSSTTSSSGDSADKGIALKAAASSSEAST